VVLFLLALFNEDPAKMIAECLQILFDKLQVLQQVLTTEYKGDRDIRDQLINACLGVEECSFSLYKPALTLQGMCADLRSAMGTAT
jgi:hypothetical protein